MDMLLTPIVFSLLCCLFLALINKSIGVRRTYVNILLKIFEYGRQNIETAKKRTRQTQTDHNDEKIEEINNSEEEQSTTGTDIKKNNVKIVPNTNGFLPEHHSNNGNSVITRDTFILLPNGDSTKNKVALNECEKEKSDEEKPTEKDEINFKLAKCLDYIKAGVEAIIEDEVTSRFEAEELKNWNLLTRTNQNYEFISWRLTVLWICGFIIRYIILMPLRVLICFIGVAWTVLSNAVVALIPFRILRQPIADICFMMAFRLITRSLSAVITIHNPENKPKNCGFCVANHTSPIDIAILSTDCTFSLIGQRHGGFLGILQRALGRASPHIWFERAEAKDRHAVAERLKQHVSDPRNPPILIFPEGTCINNTSVMQFKKGSFEVGGVIYPVAIKYDPRFGDAFWNSSRYSMMQYLFLMMTSWAIVCDVWYLPPMYRQENESAIDFANRVKSVIAKQGGLVDLVWDGQLKRMKPKKEWKEKQQVEFTKRLKGE